MALQSGIDRVRANSSGRSAMIRSQHVATLVAVFVGEGPDQGVCVKLDSSGVARDVLFRAKITYNSTDGATATRAR